MTLSYTVILTPLLSNDIYDSPVDVTEYLEPGAISQIKQQLDQGQYEIGKFVYGSITVNFNNFKGKFNDRRFDSRSIFPYLRDRAKVDITFVDNDSSTEISYRGLISDKATRPDLSKHTMKFTLLSLDSIFEQSQNVSDAIQDGDTFSDAFQVLLSTPTITSILNYSASNINPTLDLTIDDSSVFNNLLAKNVIDVLLQASNSILLIDDSANIIIRNRTENANTPHLLYYNDQFKRDNIKRILNVNNGLQRMFNSVLVNTFESKDQTSINVYKIRQKRFTFSFITDETKARIIGTSILGDFGIPKVEMDFEVSTSFAKDVEFLDKSTVDIQPLSQEFRQNNIGIYSIDEYGKAYYSQDIYDFTFPNNIPLKMIAQFENPLNFNTILRLREI